MQTKGLSRNPIDKYYTKNATVECCKQLIQQYIAIGQNDLIIEPSAGDGAFMQCIKSISPNYRFYDLEPANDEIIQQDYLTLNYKDFTSVYQDIHIIGNPPFGRQSSLAIKFIKKSCEFCYSISFILPKSFKKDSLKKAFPLNFHLLYETDLPENSFLVNNVEYNVPSLFQIWVKKSYHREIVEKLEPRNFEFVEKTNMPDISFRRVGVNAGKIDTNIDEKSEQSHYFIKFTNGKSRDENIQSLSPSKYEFNNTVGPKSISKQELIKEFAKFI